MRPEAQGPTPSGLCLYLWSYFLLFFSFIYSTTQSCCCSLTVPCILLPRGFHICFFPSVWNPLSLTSFWDLPCTFCTNFTYQRGLPWPLYLIALKEIFLKAPFSSPCTLTPITCFIVFHSTCLFLLFSFSPYLTLQLIECDVCEGRDFLYFLHWRPSNNSIWYIVGGRQILVNE